MKIIMKYFFCVIFLTVVFVTRSQSMQDSVKVPNVFTPNQDGINDVFKVDLGFDNKPQNYFMEIYNRTGLVVFTSKKEGQAWDGRTTSGMPCTEGTYFYIIQFTINSAKLEYKGFVQLFR